MPVLSLVHWYTQYPNKSHPPALNKVSHVSLIGNRNVSLDVARILLTDIDVLSKYDGPHNVFEVARPIRSCFHDEQALGDDKPPRSIHDPLSRSLPITPPPSSQLAR